MKIIPFVIAAWFRYLMAVDDEGCEMQLSFDPMLETVKKSVETLKLGVANQDVSGVNFILSSEELFGVNILEMGDMADKIKQHLSDMLVGPGAVRKELKKLVNS